MPKALNIQPGDRFERLVIIEEVAQRYKCRRFRCKCDCGKIIETYLQGLRNKETKSCGCYKDEILIQRNTSHELSRHPLYSIRTAMIQRCTNPDHKGFSYYGGRGIIICDEWKNDFTLFYNWAINHGYKKGLSIERVDNNLGYNPSNCIWATRLQQARNTRSTINLTLNGETMCLQGWADRIGINRCTLSKRLKNIPLNEALTKPPVKHQQHGNKILRIQ